MIWLKNGRNPVNTTDYAEKLNRMKKFFLQLSMSEDDFEEIHDMGLQLEEK